MLSPLSLLSSLVLFTDRLTVFFDGFDVKVVLRRVDVFFEVLELVEYFLHFFVVGMLDDASVRLVVCNFALTYDAALACDQNTVYKIS